MRVSSAMMISSNPLNNSRAKYELRSRSRAPALYHIASLILGCYHLRLRAIIIGERSSKLNLVSSGAWAHGLMFPEGVIESVKPHLMSLVKQPHVLMCTPRSMCHGRSWASQGRKIAHYLRSWHAFDVALVAVVWVDKCHWLKACKPG